MDTYVPVRERDALASSKIARTSFVPELVAESSLNTAFVCLTNKRARVVLPHPLGPQRIMLPAQPFSPWSICLSSASGPMRWSCPTKSEKLSGRQRSASGMTSFKTFWRFSGRVDFEFVEGRSMDRFLPTLCLKTGAIFFEEIEFDSVGDELACVLKEDEGVVISAWQSESK